MAGPEMTFIVHPRPNTSGLPPDTDLPASAVTKLAASVAEASKDEEVGKDTILGDILFLARYMFGRY